MTEKNPSKPSLESILRVRFKGLLDTIASFLLKIGLKPNLITLFGLAGNVLAAVLIGLGLPVWGGILAMVMGPLDAVDGAMARKRGLTGKFGAFLDSVTDRYDELFLLGGILFYFVVRGNVTGSILTYLAAVGSVLVSYTRAKAEGLGLSAKVGILTRVERYLILIPGLLFGVVIYSVGIIAILSNLTALQRILHVKKQADSQL